MSVRIISTARRPEPMRIFKGLKPLIFKGKNNTRIKFSFKMTNNLLLQPVLNSSNGETVEIPLLMDLSQTILANKKLLNINKEQEFPLEYLRNIVAGACSLSMKWGS